VNPIAFGAIFGLTLFAGISIEKFDRDVERDLGHTLVGPHKSIVVHTRVGFETIDGIVPQVTIVAKNFSCQRLPFHVEKWRSHYGHVRHLRIDLQRFTLKGLAVADLKANIPDVRFDLGFALSKHHFRLSKSVVGTMSVTIDFKSIETFASIKFPQFKDLTLKSTGDRLQVSGRAAFVGLEVPFQLSGVPTVVDETRLILADPIAIINGKPVDAPVAEKLLSRFSTLIDLNRDLGTDGGIHLKTFQVTGDALIGIGTAQVPDHDTPAETTKDGSETNLKSVPNK
jgi:hypothetical protein